MTPEEKYNRDKWFVLQKIKERELYAVNPKIVDYLIEITPYSKFDKYPPDTQINIIQQLAKEGAIKIIDTQKQSGYGAFYLFYFEVQHPKFDEIYEKYNPTQNNKSAPKYTTKLESKKEKYQQYSAESIKKIIGVINHLKEEWDLTPKETSSQNSGAYIYYKEANQASIPQRRYLSWLNDCKLDDYYQLESILTISQQEGLILEFKTISEYM